MTSYALTHSTSFAMGIAGGTVTDWRDYDSVYTERYMGLPQDNPEGYHDSSPRWAAANLHGAAAAHPRHDRRQRARAEHAAVRLRAAEGAASRSSLMLYPKSRHGVTDPLLVKHMRQMMFDFTLEHLGAASVPQPSGRK